MRSLFAKKFQDKLRPMGGGGGAPPGLAKALGGGLLGGLSGEKKNTGKTGA